MGIAHLHLHTEYSLLDGASQVDALARRAAELRLPALAITDHGNLHGARRFHDACLKHGVSPLLGCEFYVAPGSRFEKRAGRLAENANHLILIARNQEGWKNLIRLSTLGYQEGFYYRPRIDKELLASHAEGLVCLSGCLQGELPQLVKAGELDEAVKAATWYRDTFGADQYYLELQDHGIADQKQVKDTLLQMARDLGLKTVATNDSHYLTREDSQAHDALLCIGTATHVDNPDRFKFHGDQFYLKSEKEMRATFADCPEAVDNTLRVADQCSFELPATRSLMPAFEVPAGEGDEAAFLRKKAEAGLRHRYPDLPGEALARLERELEVIEKAGFPGYFLVVADFVDYAKRQGIPVGPGRGSAAGSLVSYCLGITGLDPLRYGLLFERFLNPERLQPPDIDIDFADHRRDEVIEYVRRKYGQDRVAQIATFGTLKARAVIRDTGRALNYTYGEVDTLARLIPYELNITLDQALKTSEGLQERSREPRVARLLDVARRLEGVARHVSTHAAGVVISPVPLLEEVPMCLSRSDDPGADGRPAMMTQWDMGSLEQAGLVKMDFLGLRNLTVIDDAVRMIREATGNELDLETLSMDDADTYAMLARGDSHGVFQLESDGMRDLLRRFKPVNEHDLNALIALYRPGPMQMIDEFIKRRSGRTPVTYPLPSLEPILKETWGVIVYQEQVMQIAVEVGGFSLGQADILRRAMGKKNMELLEKQRARFKEGAASRGVGEAKAEEVFDLLARFAEYGFNKSHSAAYAVVAFRTAWLKAHYPGHFLAALMSSENASAGRLAQGLAELRRLEIPVLGPDINSSGPDFSYGPEGLRFGLAAVKGMGFSAAENVARARQSGLFTSLENFLSRVDPKGINAKTIEGLIKAGALDSLEKQGHRAMLLALLPFAMESASQAQRDRESGQASLFGDLGDEAGSTAPADMAVPEWPENTRLAFEKEALGYYITGHPLARWEGMLKALRCDSAAALAEREDRAWCRVAGMVSSVKPLITKRQEAMYRIQLEDLDGTVEVMIWPKAARELGAPPREEDMLLVKGRIERNEERVQVSTEGVLGLKSAWRWYRGLHLEVKPGNEAAVEKIKTLAKGGELPIFVHWLKPGGRVTQRLGEAWRAPKSETLYETARGLWGDSFWIET